MDGISSALSTDLSDWTDETLYDIIEHLIERGGDCESVEVKAAQQGCPSVAPTLCAFANMPAGGILLLGLSEPGFVPVGLTNVAQLEAAVASIAREAVAPPAKCAFRTFQYRKHTVLACQVRPLPVQDRPARTGDLAYLRQSDGDYPMSREEVEHLELLKSQSYHRTYPDSEPVPGTCLDDLDADLLTAFIRTARASSRRLAEADTDTLLRWTKILAPNGELTMAGYYALAKYPQERFSFLKITIAAQLGPNEPGRTRDLAFLDGPLPEQLESAMAWVSRNTSKTLQYDERGHAYDTAEIPLNAVREIIANALVHRNLDPITHSQGVEIRLRDGKLTVTNPGGLRGLSVRQLGSPAGKYAVNPALYEICQRTRLPDGSRVIEAEGGGIREAKSALASAGLREPHFIDYAVRFTTIMWAHSILSNSELKWLQQLPEAKNLSSVQRAILAALWRGETLSNADIRDTYGPLDSREVTRYMQKLMDTGLVTTIGKVGGTRYCLNTDAPQASLPAAPITVSDQATASSNVDAEDREIQFLMFTRTPKSRAELEQASGLSESQVRKVLNSLRAKGLVELVGDSPRLARYRAVEQN